MQYKKCKGEITVFLTLLFSVMSAFILTVVESARIQAIRVNSEQVMQCSLHSVFGEYNQDLLSRYGLFAIDSSYRTGSGSVENVRMHLAEYAQENFRSEEKGDWLKCSPDEIKILLFQLLSDESGAVLIDQAVKYEQDRGQLPNRSDFLHASRNMQGDGGNDFMSNFAEHLSQSGAADNPAEEVYDTAVNTDLTDIVIEGGFSGHTMRSDCASRRSLQAGTYSASPAAYDDATFLFDAYLMHCFGNFVEYKDYAVFACETEYLISGKHAEKDCLRDCAAMILTQREDRNLPGFLENEAVLTETEELAEQLCAEGGDPYHTQMSLIYAWAYAQSAIEVSRLLYGGYCEMDGCEDPVVPLRELTHFTDYCYACAGSGESYSDYLTGLLIHTDRNRKVMRCMDLIEINLQHAGHEGFRVDTCVTYFRGKMTVASTYGHGCEVEREYGYFTQ